MLAFLVLRVNILRFMQFSPLQRKMCCNGFFLYHTYSHKYIAVLLEGGERVTPSCVVLLKITSLKLLLPPKQLFAAQLRRRVNTYVGKLIITGSIVGPFWSMMFSPGWILNVMYRVGRGKSLASKRSISVQGVDVYNLLPGVPSRYLCQRKSHKVSPMVQFMVHLLR